MMNDKLNEIEKTTDLQDSFTHYSYYSHLSCNKNK
jgi:hypothetical protein